MFTQIFNLSTNGIGGDFIRKSYQRVFWFKLGTHEPTQVTMHNHT